MSDIDYVREGFARGWQGDGSMVDMDEAFADNEREFDRWLAQHDAEVAKAAKVEALREAADEWTQGAWAKDMAPGNDRPSLILGTSQRAANFLRAIANSIEAGEGA